jgi:hypothetical protein
LLTRWTATVLERESGHCEIHRDDCQRSDRHRIAFRSRGEVSKAASSRTGATKRAKARSGSISMGRREWQEGKTGARERKERRRGNFKPTREPGNKHGAAWHRKV